jgi:hypothetical protein
VAAALACGVVALMVSGMGRMFLESVPAFTTRKPGERDLLRLISGFVAGMALGLSRTVWRVAVVAEIWALTVFLFAAMLCLLMRWMVGPERRRFLYASILMFGLLLTSNQELVSLIPALLVCVLLGDRALGRDLSLPIAFLAVSGWVASRFGSSPWFGAYAAGNIGLLAAFSLVGIAAAVTVVRTRRFGSEWRSAGLCGVALLLGLGCYFYLPLASMTNPPVNWGYARTVEGFLHTVTRGQYERYAPTSELGRFILQLGTLVKESWTGLGWPYYLFIALPFGFLWRAERRARNWLLGSAAVFICVGPLLVELLNPSNDRGSVDYIRPFFAPMYVVLALWTGLGLIAFGSLVAERRNQPQPDMTPV